MKKYKVRIKSTTPLIINVRQKEMDDEKKTLKKNELDEWESKNWVRKAKIDEKGNVIFDSAWIRGAFVNACKHSRIVPHFATKKNETYTRYAQALFFNKISFTDNIKESKLEPFGAYVGINNSKIWAIRPSLKEWTAEFEIVDGFGRMTIEELKTLLEFSGQLEGVGDARSLNFGRFEIESIKETK